MSSKLSESSKLSDVGSDTSDMWSVNGTSQNTNENTTNKEFNLELIVKKEVDIN